MLLKRIREALVEWYSPAPGEFDRWVSRDSESNDAKAEHRWLATRPAKISMNHVLCEHLPLGLKDAKGCVDAVLAGQSVSFTFDASSEATALAQALEDLGRCSRN